MSINFFGQSSNDPTAGITYVTLETNKKELAKEISQFKSKEYIINTIIGPAGNEEFQFETESLAADDSGGLISVAFNCDKVDKRGLLLSFFGDHRNQNGVSGTAYGFRYIPLKDAQDLLIRLMGVKSNNKKYMSKESDVNNVYVQFEDIKFVLYKDGGEKVRVLWNGFEVIWEKTAYQRTKRRLDKWFE
ncbi:MAG: hypothetical protein BM564_13515 [Bacteroidetes bacterium MedPE-SWsnd-G2]|nr:MAG: hypothetical protein BM564_13515 [Bacteroidetes bacterium MedPE-SWsnd-G2]